MDPGEEHGTRRETRSTTSTMQMEIGDLTTSTSTPRPSRTVAAIEEATPDASVRPDGKGGDGKIEERWAHPPAPN